MAQELTREERLVVQMYYGDELVLEEIAAVLDIDVAHAGAVLRGAVEKAQRTRKAK